MSRFRSLGSPVLGMMIAVAFLGKPAAATPLAPNNDSVGLQPQSDERWIRQSGASAEDIVLSPDESRIYVATSGRRPGPLRKHGVSVYAFDAASGTLLWSTFFYGQGGGFANAVAVSADGSTVFAAGAASFGGTSYDYVTVACDAETGAQLWVSRYNGPGNGNDIATSLAITPNGEFVFVTGNSVGAGGDTDYATLAIHAADGTSRWTAVYDGPSGRNDGATAIGLAPSGQQVFVTGTSFDSTNDYATVAYASVDGARQWVARYDGTGKDNDSAADLAVDPDGSSVYVVGASDSETSSDYTAVAYQSDSGTERWVASYDGPSGGADGASAVATTHGGLHEIFVTGKSESAPGNNDYATLAYDAFSGTELWEARYDGPAGQDDVADALAVTEDDSRVLVTGGSGQFSYHKTFCTIVYDAILGNREALIRTDFSNRPQVAHSIAVTKDGGGFYIAGASSPSYTIAYGVL